MEGIDDSSSRLIDKLMDAMAIRRLTDEELGELERRILESDVTVGRLVNRCQLESDLRHLFGSDTSTKLILAERDALADQFEQQQLRGPADRAQ